jgi:hypothetical protein
MQSFLNKAILWSTQLVTLGTFEMDTHKVPSRGEPTSFPVVQALAEKSHTRKFECH